MADGVTIPDLTTAAGTIAALAAIVVFFYRKMDADNKRHAELLAKETEKCEDNYRRLDEKFDAQATWQRETMIGTIEANTMELNAIRRDLRAHDMLPQNPEDSLSLPSVKHKLTVKSK